MARELLLDEIRELLAHKARRGRPLQRDKWAALIENELGKRPNGLEPRDLQRITGLEPHQIAAGVKWLRDHTHDGPPVLYVPSEGRWFAATSWEQTRSGMRDVFARRAASLVLSLEHLAEQSREQWPEASREIKRLVKDAVRVREDMDDLVSGLI